MFDRAGSDQMPGLEAARAAPPAADMLAMNACWIFGANLKRVHEALGLSLDQLAAILGLAAEHLAEIEADLVSFR